MRTIPRRRLIVTPSIRHALDQAGVKHVSVSQDRDKNLITLTGKVASDNDKLQAESIARSIVGTQVVSNQISVRLPERRALRRKWSPTSTKELRRTSMPCWFSIG
ncbi:MAG: hypothetical protein DMG76_26695 [Acidobacteria bacterium]|nr:MAG: hypothetical protein DMG76_26695 [Acidobacteriota bacterium]